jgi:uncharacterized repeat protein (TIGR03803 family)
MKLNLLKMWIVTLVCCAPSAHAQTLTTLHGFGGAPSDGAESYGGLSSRGGRLFGATNAGGSADLGAIFSFDIAAGTEALLHSYVGGPGGEFPQSQSLLFASGTLYGSITQGDDTGCGGDGCGNLFTVNPNTGAYKITHKFRGRVGGGNPGTTLVSAGNTFYGGTDSGGIFNGNCVFEGTDFGCGTIFALNPATNGISKIYDFQGGADGEGPNDVTYHGGFLYGTTHQSLTPGFGTVFEIDLSTNIETVLYRFSGDPDTGGINPVAGVIYLGGNLYGTTNTGGAVASGGVVFKVDVATGRETVLHSFGGSGDASNPGFGALVYLSGLLYGTTYLGGTQGKGAIYSIDLKTGSEQVVYSFTGGADGSTPYTGLVEYQGSLYGTTSSGGAAGYGTIYSLAP